MKRLQLTLLLYSVALLMSAPGQSQDRSAIEAQGRELGTTLQGLAAGNVKDDSNLQATVPNYQGTNVSQTQLADDPDGLVSQGKGAASNSDAYQTIRDPSRPEFDPKTIDLSRGTDIAENPDKYVGVATEGQTGKCQPLPPESGAGSEYFETCNDGVKIAATTETCKPRMVPTVVRKDFFHYYVTSPSNAPHGFVSSDVMNAKVSAGICTATGVTKQVCDAQIELGAGGDNPADYLKFCRSTVKGDASEYKCSTELTSAEAGFHYNSKAGTVYLSKTSDSTVSVVRDDSACAGLAGDTSCVDQGETCAEGPETRIIDGVAVTQSCWAWTHTYQCTRKQHANDCATVAAKPKCTFDHEECLDDPRQGECQVKDMVYRCKADPPAGSGSQAWLCSGDIYCINGECTKVEREASTEFKDAMVAVHTLGDVRDQFDPNSLTLFNGTVSGCHKPIFGLVDCCAGKTSGLLSVAAGAAAIAGGPAAIAGIATQFLTLFLCSTEEKLLDVKDRMGLCHYVGTYCSEQLLFICSTKRKTYCCFESKLARILQEQGRAQIGKSWGTPKEANCKGFSIDEFQKLDLSKMDFTEVYDEFIDAAKVPDEVQASLDIQKKVREYYDLHTKK